MEERLDNQPVIGYVPTACDNINTDDIASSPYFTMLVDAWYKRFPNKIEYIEQPVEDTQEVIAAASAVGIEAAGPAPLKEVCKKKPSRRMFPLAMVFVFAVIALAVAVVGIFEIELIAAYTALSGSFVSVVSLIDCFSNAGLSIDGIFSCVFPAALYLSLAVTLIVVIVSAIGFAKSAKVNSFAWLTIVAFLLALLSAVSLYIVSGAPAIGDFFAFGQEGAIGYAFLAILGLDLLAFIFALFVNRKATEEPAE